MALKKSELNSSLWASCDELRGRMDASQYKDDVLVLLFIKYVSDKYAGMPYAPITIPPGSTAIAAGPILGCSIQPCDRAGPMSWIPALFCRSGPPYLDASTLRRPRTPSGIFSAVVLPKPSTNPWRAPLPR